MIFFEFWEDDGEIKQVEIWKGGSAPLGFLTPFPHCSSRHFRNSARKLCSLHRELPKRCVPLLLIHPVLRHTQWPTLSASLYEQLDKAKSSDVAFSILFRFLLTWFLYHLPRTLNKITETGRLTATEEDLALSLFWTLDHLRLFRWRREYPCGKEPPHFSCTAEGLLDPENWICCFLPRK